VKSSSLDCTEGNELQKLAEKGWTLAGKGSNNGMIICNHLVVDRHR
jgi:hypothetical protein